MKMAAHVRSAGARCSATSLRLPAAVLSHPASPRRAGRAGFVRRRRGCQRRARPARSSRSGPAGAARTSAASVARSAAGRPSVRGSRRRRRRRKSVPALAGRWRGWRWDSGSMLRTRRCTNWMESSSSQCASSNSRMTGWRRLSARMQGLQRVQRALVAGLRVQPGVEGVVPVRSSSAPRTERLRSSFGFQFVRHSLISCASLWLKTRLLSRLRLPADSARSSRAASSGRG